VVSWDILAMSEGALSSSGPPLPRVILLARLRPPSYSSFPLAPKRRLVALWYDRIVPTYRQMARQETVLGHHASSESSPARSAIPGRPKHRPEHRWMRAATEIFGGDPFIRSDAPTPRAAADSGGCGTYCCSGPIAQPLWMSSPSSAGQS